MKKSPSLSVMLGWGSGKCYELDEEDELYSSIFIFYFSFFGWVKVNFFFYLLIIEYPSLLIRECI